MKIARRLLVFAGLALAGPAFSDGEGPKLGGFVLGARLGVAWSAGRGTADAPRSLPDSVPRAYPLGLDLGGRLSFGLGFGGYAQVAPATASCPASSACSAGGYFRFGLYGEYRFRNGERVMPWLGASAGWEILNWEEDPATARWTAYTWAGPEFGLQGGVDVRLGRRWAIGPYAMVAFSRYDSQRLEVSNGPGPDTVTTGSIPSDRRRWHEWAHLGVRASVTF